MSTVKLFLYHPKFNILNCFRLKCKRCFQDVQRQPPPENTDCTSHLSQWFHCSNNRGLPDSVLSEAWTASKCVSFVFHHRSQGEAKKSSAALPAEEESSIENVQPTSKKRKKIKDSDAEDDSDYELDDSADGDFMGF